MFLCAQHCIFTQLAVPPLIIFVVLDCGGQLYNRGQVYNCTSFPSLPLIH